MPNGVNLKSLLESILFIQGEPMPVQRLAKIAGAKAKEVAASLRELQAERRETGIILVENGDVWQYATNPANQKTIQAMRAAERSGDLSRASLEVLAIIAYKGPLSRAEIEYVRGVDSSFTLRSLLIRGLVEREENAKDHRSYLYRVAMEFLKHLGLGSATELSNYREFRKQTIDAPAPPADAV